MREQSSNVDYLHDIICYIDKVADILCEKSFEQMKQDLFKQRMNQGTVL